MARILLQRLDLDHRVVDVRMVKVDYCGVVLTHEIQSRVVGEFHDFFDAMVPETFYDHLLKNGQVNMTNNWCTTIVDSSEIFIFTIVG